MLKKEFRDTLRILLESSLLLLSVPVIILFSFIMGFKINILQLLKVTSIVTIFAFSGYSGLGMFLWEKRDKGSEYLLTLPMSKLKIFIYKFLPRFLLLALLAVLSHLFFGINGHYFIALLFIQLGGVFLSLAFSSFFMAFITIFLLGFFYSLAIQFIIRWFKVIHDFSFNPFELISPYVLAALLLGIPLAVSFFLAFKNYDLKPFKYAVKPYLFIGLPLILVQALVIFFYYEKLLYL